MLVYVGAQQGSGFTQMFFNCVARLSGRMALFQDKKAAVALSAQILS
jgi:hypothetical protein